MRVIIKICAIALLVGAVYISTNNLLDTESRERTKAYKTIEATITSNQTITENTLFIERALTLLARIDPVFLNIKVNEIPKNNEISIIIINAGKYNYNNEQSSIFSKAKRNMIVVGNKYIVIDEVLLNVILMNSQTEQAATIEVDWNSKFNPQKFDDNSKRRTYEMMAMLQLSNIEYLITSLDENSLVSDNNPIKMHRLITGVTDKKTYYTKIINAGFDPIKGSSPITGLLAYDLSSASSMRDENFPFSDVFVAPFAATLASFLLHEIGHIRSEYQGSFLGETLSIINDSILKRMYIEEQKADDFSLSYIKKWQESTMPEIDIKGYKYSIGRGIYIAGKILENISFHENLNWFRNTNPQSIGSQIIYNDLDCTNSERGFFDVNFIKEIKESYMPIITENELNQLTSESKKKTTSHPHTYFRAKNFQEYAINNLETTYGNKTTRSSFVRGILTGNPSQISASNLKEAYQKDLERLFYGKMQSGIAIPTHILEHLRKFEFKRENAAACPFDKCQIYSKDDDTYLEFGINNNKLVYFSFYVRNFSTTPKERNGRWLKSSKESFKRLEINLITMQSLLQHISGNTNTFNEREFYHSYIKKHAECGFASYSIKNKFGEILISTTDNDKSILMSFYSN